MPNQTKRPSVPTWAMSPFRAFVEYVHHEGEIVHLAVVGISQLERGVPLAEALAALDRDDDSEDLNPDPSVEQARTIAAAAARERESGFTRIYAHSLVSVWGGLEVLVEDVVVEWLTHRPSLLRQEAFARVRVTLADFQAATRDDRLRYLVGECGRQVPGGSGISRFEGLFGLIGLEGIVAPEVRRSLIEMQAVRNAVAHRRSRVDRKLRSDCPWRTDWKLGKALRIDTDAWSGYLEATNLYAAELIHRTGDRFGVRARPTDAT